jgi:hypothetical protein
VRRQLSGKLCEYQRSDVSRKVFESCHFGFASHYLTDLTKIDSVVQASSP